MKRTTLSLAIAGAMALVATVNASVISVNFATTTTRDLAAGDSAGLSGYQAANWNNLTGWSGYVGSGTDVPLGDDTGAGTTAALTYNTHMWNDDNLTTPDGTLGSSYLNDYSDNTAGTITVTGVPYAEYKVIVYHSTDAGTGFDGVTVNGALQADCTFGTASAASKVYLNANGWVDGANCRVVDNVTGSTLTIDLGARAGTVRSTAAGIQIVQIPEPATLGMVAVFGGGILFIRRKLML